MDRLVGFGTCALKILTQSGAWAYPPHTAFADHGRILIGSGWDAVQWNAHSQGLVAVGGTIYLFYEAGDVWNVEHAEHSKLGVLTSTDGVTWADFAGNPIAEFLPGNPGPNPDEEGYWYHAVWRRPNGEWTCVFGGQTGVTSTQVEINIYKQTSSDGFSWTPNSAAGAIRIIDEDNSSFAGFGTFNDEIGATGLWYDELGGIWHIIYVSKNISSEEWSAYHAQGSNLESLVGANSNILLHKNNNPYVAGAPMRASAIIDRGSGIIDVIIQCHDNTASPNQKAALIRVPILPDYSWTSPGPPEILYYMDNDFSLSASLRSSVGFFPSVSKALIPYTLVSNQDLRMKSASAVQTSDGRLPYAPASARFSDGTSDQFLSKVSGLVGQASSSKFVFSFAIKMAAGPPFAEDQTLLRLRAGGNVRFQIVVRTTGEVGFFARNSANTQVLSVDSTSTIDHTKWYTVAVSIDMSNYSNCHFYIDRVTVKPVTPTTFTAGQTIDFGAVTECMFGHESAAVKKLNAEVADFGFTEGVSFNLSDVRVLNRFFTTANELQNPAVDGRRMFLKKPLVFFSGNGSAFPTNQGSGESFTVNNGPLTNGSNPQGHL